MNHIPTDAVLKRKRERDTHQPGTEYDRRTGRPAPGPGVCEVCGTQGMVYAAKRNDQAHNWDNAYTRCRVCDERMMGEETLDAYLEYIKQVYYFQYLRWVE